MNFKTYVILKKETNSDEIKISTSKSSEVFKENVKELLLLDSVEITGLCSISNSGEVREISLDYNKNEIVYSEVESYSIEEVKEGKILALFKFSDYSKALPFKTEEMFLSFLKDNFEKKEIIWILKLDLNEKKYTPMELEIYNFKFNLKETLSKGS